MSKIGIYPGTFDPITYGHIDIIKRTLKIVNRLIVAVSSSNDKEYLFSADEREWIFIANEAEGYIAWVLLTPYVSII